MSELRTSAVKTLRGLRAVGINGELLLRAECITTVRAIEDSLLQ
jgi:hypothetical protein